MDKRVNAIKQVLVVWFLLVILDSSLSRTSDIYETMCCSLLQLFVANFGSLQYTNSILAEQP